MVAFSVLKTEFSLPKIVFSTEWTSALSVAKFDADSKYQILSQNHAVGKKKG
jgi:hypothetical protein